MNTLYLVENSLGNEDSVSGKVISLSPETSYSLSCRKYPYEILETYLEQSGLAQFESEYFIQQQQWIANFDRHLKKNIPFCQAQNIHLAKAHFWRLKYFLDSLVESAWAFKALIEKTRPSEIHYLSSKKTRTNNSITFLYDNSKKFYFPVVSSLCRHFNIPLIHKQTHASQIDLNEKSGKPNFYNFRSSLKMAYRYIKDQQYKRFIYATPEYRNISALVLDAGPKDVQPIVKNMMLRGSRIYTKLGTKIYQSSNFIQSLAVDFEIEKNIFSNRLESDFLKASSALARNDLITWANEVCQLDISDLVISNLTSFIDSHCLSVTSEVMPLRDFYNRENMNYVIARSGATHSNMSSFIAASKSLKTKTVCFQHGITALDRPIEYYTETAAFDIYFASDPQSFHHLRARVNDKKTCIIREYSDFLKPKRPKKSALSNVETIFYVPTRSQVGVRMLNCFYPYSANWHYHFQIAMLEYLATLKNKRIVFKYVRSPDWLEKSVLAYLADKKYPNIALRYDNLTDCLHEANRVIIDYPGTALYESAAAGISTLGLYRHDMKIKLEAQMDFGRILQPFVTIEDAIAKVGRFLEEKPENFRHPISLTSEDAANTLLQLSGESIFKTNNLRVSTI